MEGAEAALADETLPSWNWTTPEPSVMRARPRSEFDTDDEYHEYCSKRRAQQMAQIEKNRPARDRTNRKRSPRKAAPKQQQQQHKRHRLDEAQPLVPDELLAASHRLPSTAVMQVPQAVPPPTPSPVQELPACRALSIAPPSSQPILDHLRQHAPYVINLVTHIAPVLASAVLISGTGLSRSIRALVISAAYRHLHARSIMPASCASVTVSASVCVCFKAPRTRHPGPRCVCLPTRDTHTGLFYL